MLNINILGAMVDDKGAYKGVEISNKYTWTMMGRLGGLTRG